jgi:uncharacterized protein YigE (DUF2233 family)
MQQSIAFKACFLGIALLAAGCGTNADRASTEPASARSACRSIIFEGSRFTLCTADPGNQTIMLALTDPQDVPLRDFARLEHALGDGRDTVSFAMNAGMFDANGLPIGLYVDHGVQRHALNQRNGAGNFHMVPNGVFYGDARGWHIATTSAFAALKPAGLTFATQSGPMLVVGGALNPTFGADGPSHYVRNGVGIDPSGKALFAISDTPVSFGRFARLFRDRLGCADALYLDGAVSLLWDPASGRRDTGAPIGPIVVVTQTR